MKNITKERLLRTIYHIVMTVTIVTASIAIGYVLNSSAMARVLDYTVTLRGSVLALFGFALLVFLIAASELQSAQIKSKAILESIGEGFIVLDKKGEISVINRAALLLLGLSLPRIRRKSFFDIVHIDLDGEKVLVPDHPVSVAIHNEKSLQSKDYYFTGPDGRRFPVDISIAPEMIHGQVDGAIVVFHDISKEKAVDTAKNEFISLVSHQLRTPLSAMNWSLEMLLDSNTKRFTKKQNEYLQRLEENNKRMVTLVNTILDVSRMELNTFETNVVPTQVESLIDATILDWQHEIDEKNLDVHQNRTKRDKPVRIDPRYAKMIVDTLLTNAIKYTPEGGSIIITPTYNKEFLKLSIKDTGYGIPNKETEQIFTKLFRASNITDKYTEGKGLGLYMVKKIVDFAGGKIWFESKENEGTTFFVTLPLHKNDKA